MMEFKHIPSACFRLLFIIPYVRESLCILHKQLVVNLYCCFQMFPFLNKLYIIDLVVHSILL